MDGEEKKDASKEDLDQEGGECVCLFEVCLIYGILTLPILSLH